MEVTRNYAKTLISKSGCGRPDRSHGTTRQSNVVTRMPPSCRIPAEGRLNDRSTRSTRTHYYSTVLNPATQDDFGTAGWGADWPNATTVIPPLFTLAGSFDLSATNDTNGGVSDWLEQVAAAQQTVDRSAQATLWQGLNSTAGDEERVRYPHVLFGLAQDMGGTNVGAHSGGQRTVHGRMASSTSRVRKSP